MLIKGRALFSWGEGRPRQGRSGWMARKSGLSRGREGPLEAEVCPCGMWYLRATS